MKSNNQNKGKVRFASDFSKRCLKGQKIKSPCDFQIPAKGEFLLDTGVFLNLKKGGFVVASKPIDFIRIEFQFMDALRNNPAECELAVTLFNDTDSIKHIPSGTVLGKIGWVK